MHDRLRHALLGRWAALICDHSAAVLLAAFAVAGVAIWITVGYLGFEADRNALISEDLPWNSRYIEYRRRFAPSEQIAAAWVAKTSERN